MDLKVRSVNVLKMNFGDKYCLGRLLGNSYKNTQSVDKRHLEMLLQWGGIVIHWTVTRMC